MGLEVRAGDRVRIRGCFSDCTEYMDGQVGVVLRVQERDLVVDFDNEILYIWKTNVTEVIK